MLFISHYLYSKFARGAIATLMAILLSLTFATAQMHTRDRQTPDTVPTVTAKKAKRGPRAIAVVEFLPNGSTRLVPIALWVEGRYYDASEYGANPAPMALEPETVYEAQSFGEPTGTFTVTSPEQVNGNWVADGNWQPELPMDVQARKKAAKDAAERAKNPPSAVVMTGDADSGKPVLKRAPGSAGDSPSSGQTAPATTTSGNSGAVRAVRVLRTTRPADAEEAGERFELQAHPRLDGRSLEQRDDDNDRTKSDAGGPGFRPADLEAPRIHHGATFSRRQRYWIGVHGVFPHCVERQRSESSNIEPHESCESGNSVGRRFFLRQCAVCGWVERRARLSRDIRCRRLRIALADLLHVIGRTAGAGATDAQAGDGRNSRVRC